MSLSRSNTSLNDTTSIKSSGNNAVESFGQLCQKLLLGISSSRRDGLHSSSSLPKLVQQRAGYKISSVTPVRSEGLTQNDFIIAIMGPTGAGKSTFIQIASGQDSQDSGVGHGLESCTSEVTAVRICFTDDINVVLVDTPGFDDTYLSDLQVLEIIAKWLKDASQYELCGIFFLHRVSDNRMSGTPLKNLTMFQKLCGPDFFEKVVLMTTMWPESEESPDGELCVEREKDLECNYWKSMMDRGSTTSRFKKTQESSWTIIDHLIASESRRQWIRIQEELVDQGKKLIGTEAGQQLHGLTGELVQRQTDFLRRMTEELKKTNDPAILQALMTELGELRREKKKAERDLRQLDSSIVGALRRIFVPTRLQNPLRALRVITSVPSQNRRNNGEEGSNNKNDDSTRENKNGHSDRGREQDTQNKNNVDHEDNYNCDNGGQHAYTGRNDDEGRNNHQSRDCSRGTASEGEGGASEGRLDGSSPPPNSPQDPRSPSSEMFGTLELESRELLLRSGNIAHNHRSSGTDLPGPGRAL